IPIHLITKEALDIYLNNLADDGLIAFHISNRYLDLEPVLANLALAANPPLATLIEHDNDMGIVGKAGSLWVVVARQESDLDRLLQEGRWKHWQAMRGWTTSREALRILAAF